MPDRTHRFRTEASPVLWVIVAEPAAQPDEAEGVARPVAVSLGGGDGVPGGAVADGAESD
ncbi:hypothetical protein [Streptomyces alanosinicus]|uniref:hypothetical protein n=1 Tax=Streptomyces alanosinicus TaxID=68171 RepID=UPI00167BAC48|nr:hypothetical protein [Streptomyces alanosinicus]